MLKNRAMKVTFEKSPTDTAEPYHDAASKITLLEAKINLFKVHAKDTAIGVVALYGAVKFISTASEIAINAAPKR